jgi:hypothetical protein
MKQAESRGRHLYGNAVTGLILAAMLAVLGACGEIVDNSLGTEGEIVDNSQRTEGEPTRGKKGETVKVRVTVPKDEDDAARSMTIGSVQRLVNFYEVIFKTKPADGQTPLYYRGMDTDGTIIVNVPIAEDYEVLLLAGFDSTLLAAGYNNDVDLQPDVQNIVSIKMTRFPLQWDTSATSNEINTDSDSPNDFKFSAKIAAYTDTNNSIEIKPRYINVAPVIAGLPALGATNIVKDDTFTVKVNLSRLEPLFRADLETEEDDKTKTDMSKLNLTFENRAVKLWPRYDYSQFSSVGFNLTNNGTSPGDDADSGKIEVSGSSPTLTFTSNTALPRKNTDGALQFDLNYRAFGAPNTTKDSTGTSFRLWIIRNGLRSNVQDATADTSGGTTERGTGNGSEFVVKFGEGINPPTIVTDNK